MSLLSLQNLDKSTWQKLPFSEIAQSISERVDPTTTDLETYVGLEHIDAESIRIKRFGNREDVTGTKLRCYPGDVIFGRRRAYQRKAAICEFDGFCSAHSLVLRAIPEVIDPKLFPFFLHSDQFMHRAVDISVGGLSPTINWTKLKKEEFLLPPKDEQAKLAELLYGANEVVENQNTVHSKMKTVLEAERWQLNQGELTKYLGEELTTLIAKGSSPKWQGFKYADSGVLFVTSENVRDDEIDLKEGKYLPLEFHEKQKRSKLKKGDVLINLVGASIGRLAVFDVDVENANVNQAVGVFRCKPELVSPEYIVQYLLERENNDRLVNNQSESARPNLSLFNLREFDFFLPGLEEQQRRLKKIVVVKEATEASRSQLAVSRSLLKSLINQIF